MMERRGVKNSTHGKSIFKRKEVLREKIGYPKTLQKRKTQ